MKSLLARSRPRGALLACGLIAGALFPTFAWAGGGEGADAFLWLVLFLVAARLGGLVERVGMPGVLGELLAGIVLGNLALVGIGALEPLKKDQIVAFMAHLGVVILLLQVGMESRLSELAAVGGRALAVAIIGVVVPFGLGVWVVGPWLLPGQDFKAYLFLGAALSATSVGITGRVFRDLNKLDSVEARVVLGAAVIDDVLGLIILAVLSALVKEGSVSTGAVMFTIGEAVLFLGGAIFIGRLLAPWLSKFMAAIDAGAGMKFAMVMIVGLSLAWLAQFIGLASIVGAFAAGLVLEPAMLKSFAEPEVVSDVRGIVANTPEIKGDARMRIDERLDDYAHHHHRNLVEPIGFLFVPVFFVYTGMQVNLASFADPKILATAIGITVAAVVGKLVSGIAAGSANKWLVGWGMVPRGEVGLIFAMVGRELNVVNDAVFSVIVIMVVLTTLVTPPILQALLKKQLKQGQAV